MSGVMRCAILLVLVGVLNGPSFAQKPAAPAESTGEAAVAPSESVENMPDAPVSAKVLRYAKRVISAYDQDGSETLSPKEMEAMRGDPSLADLNDDGNLEVAEFAQYVANFGRRRKVRLLYSPDTAEGSSPSPSDAAASAATDTASPGDDAGAGADDPGAPESGALNGASAATRTFHVRRRSGDLPNWFAARDTDGDGQVSMAEYAPNASRAETTDFAAMDKNGDGFIVPRELVGPKAEKTSGRTLTRDSRRTTSNTQAADAKDPGAEKSEAATEGAAEPSTNDAPAEGDSPKAGTAETSGGGQSARRKGGLSRRGGKSRSKQR